MSYPNVIRRVSLVLVSLGAVTTAVLLIGGGGASGHTGSTVPNGLTTTTIATTLNPATGTPTSNAGGPSSTLPPSRDNDAGHSRIRDQYPDADVDWYQWH